MITKYLAAGVLVLATTTVAWGAPPTSRVDKDGGFYATPTQKGAPRDLPGEQLIPGVNLAVDVIDGVTRPLIVDPIQTAGAALPDPFADPAAAPAAAGAPKASGRHRRAHKHVHLAAAHHQHHHAHKKRH